MVFNVFDVPPHLRETTDPDGSPEVWRHLPSVCQISLSIFLSLIFPPYKCASPVRAENELNILRVEVLLFTTLSKI